MTLVPFGASPAPVEVDFGGTGLFIGMQLFEIESGVPTPVGGVVHMTNYDGTSYQANVTGNPGAWYVAKFKAYTDNTYTTVDTSQPQGQESLYFELESGGGGGSPGTNVGQLTVHVSGQTLEVELCDCEGA
jgi:hypothetical protein